MTKREQRALVDAIILSLAPYWLSLAPTIQFELEAVVKDAVAQAVVDNVAVPSHDLLQSVHDFAVAYAKEHAGELITLLEETTKDKIREAVADAVANNLSTEEIIERIKQTGVFEPWRATMIAETEITNAIAAGQYEGWKQAGIKKVMWSTTSDDPCIVCLLNDGKIREIGQPFPSGDLMPTAHPNCQCILSAVFSS